MIATPTDTARAPVQRDFIRARRLPPYIQGKALWLLFGVLFALYSLTSGGHMAFADDEELYFMTQGLVERHRPDVPADIGTWLSVPKGNDGLYFPKYPLLQPVLAIPFYIAGSVVADAFDPAYRGYITHAAVTVLTALASAATAVIVALLAAELGRSPRASIGLGLLWGVTTIAWPFSKYFWSEPLAALWLTAAVLFAVRGSHRHSLREWIASGACLVLGVMTRLPMLVSILGLGPYILLGSVGVSGWRKPRLVWRRVAMFAAVLLVAQLGVFGLSFLRYGSILDPHNNVIAFGRGILSNVLDGGPGLAGQLVSPGKSVFLYSPVLVCSVLAFPTFARRFPREALLIAGVLGANLLFVSPLFYWSGDPTWGPRFLVPLVPLLMLPLVVWLDGRRASHRWLIAATAAAGIAVQLLGVLVQFEGYISMTADRPDQRYWNAADSPILGHARILLDRLDDFSPLPKPIPATVEPGAVGEMVLGQGFFGSERSDTAFPRWLEDTSAVHFASSESGPAALWLDLGAPALPAGAMSFDLDGKPLPAGAVQITRTATDERVLVSLGNLAPDLHHVKLRLSTTAPQDAPPGAVALLDDLMIYQNGLPFNFRHPPVIGPLPVSTAEPWGRSAYGWFDDGRVPHLADVWPWYIAHSGLPGWLAGLAVIPAAGLVAAGVALHRQIGRASDPRLIGTIGGLSFGVLIGIVALASRVPGTAAFPFFQAPPTAAPGTWRIDDNHGRMLTLPPSGPLSLRVDYLDAIAPPVVINFEPVKGAGWQYAKWVLPRDGSSGWRTAELTVPGSDEPRALEFSSSTTTIFKPLVSQPIETAG